jgi:hypothetical protein
MNSIFETQRQTHEEIERYEHALAEVLLQAPTAVSFGLPSFMWPGALTCSNATLPGVTEKRRSSWTE